MKKLIILVFLFLIGSVTYAQTGVGISNPQQQMHVSGTVGSTPVGTTGINLIKPTIRIDGLNNTNNTVAKGSTSVVQPVDVTQNGDLILSPNIVIPLVSTMPGTDAITISAAAATATPTDSVFISVTLNTYKFTLNQTSLVHFLASVSTAVYDSGGARLSDSKNRICSSAFRFTAVPTGSGIALNTSFGSETMDYTNTSASAGATGNMYLQPEMYIVLPPGSYTVILLGQAYGASYSFNAVYGQGPDDMVSIVATAL